jgi:hypothetical protein
MNKEFIPYEQALALKELGFDEPCFCYWYTQQGSFPSIRTKDIQFNGWKNYLDSNTVAPLFQQAFRWFREKYQLHSTITSISQESWQWHITKPSESLGKLYQEDFYTYEEAESACLKKLIEIVKDGTKINTRED